MRQVKYKTWIPAKRNPTTKEFIPGKYEDTGSGWLHTFSQETDEDGKLQIVGIIEKLNGEIILRPVEQIVFIKPYDTVFRIK